MYIVFRSYRSEEVLENPSAINISPHWGEGHGGSTWSDGEQRGSDRSNRDT